MKPWRRVLSSLNLLITLVFLGVLFILVNYVASRRYSRIDVTRNKLSTLSEQTIQVLKGLNTPVSAIVFYQPQTTEGRPVPLYPLITDLLKEYERFTDQLTIEHVDPYSDPARAKQLVQELQIDNPNLVIFRSGTRHKYLSDGELAEFDYGTLTAGGEPRVKAFKGEEAFTSAILGVTQAAQPLLWLTTGHGEKSMETTEADGISDLQKYLEQQNMVVTPVNLLEHTAIPPDVKLVIIPGPARRLTEVELELLQAYLEQGGSLLALIDPLQDTGLDDLLARWGIRLGMDIVVDPARQLPFVSAANLFVTTYTQHPIVQKMKTLMTLFPLARSVGPTEPAPEGVTVSPLALTSASGWGESRTSESAFAFAEGEDLKGPVSIAAAAERSSPARTRLVVVGDSEFIVNGQLGNVGNRDLLLGAVNWLAQQEYLIGIGPKTLESMKLNLTSGQLIAVFWFSFAAMPVVSLLLGVAVWWLRRS